MQDKSFQSLRVIFLAFISCFIYQSVVLARVPEPKSEGKFITSKGTKAEAGAEENLGGSTYEYGKGLRLGPAFLKPYIGYSHEWDNNIFMDENGRESDHINKVDTGIAAELPLGGGQHLVTGSYGAAFEWFERYGNEDHVDQTFNAGVDLNYVPFTLSVDDTYMMTTDRSGTEFTSRIKRDENTVRGLLEVPFAAFFLETEVFDLNVDYDDILNDPFDHNSFAIYQRAGIDVGASTQALVEYSYQTAHYPDADDRSGDANQGSLGLRGHWTERLSYQGWFGYQAREYNLNSSPDFYGLVLRGALRYMLSEVSSITIKADRSPRESTFGTQNYYTGNRVQLSWTQQIAERWSFNTGQVIQLNQYSAETRQRDELITREDLVWESSIGLEYKMPNDLISIFGEYRYDARESNLDFFSYGDHVISAGVRANF